MRPWMFATDITRSSRTTPSGLPRLVWVKLQALRGVLLEGELHRRAVELVESRRRTAELVTGHDRHLLDGVIDRSRVPAVPDPSRRPGRTSTSEGSALLYACRAASRVGNGEGLSTSRN